MCVQKPQDSGAQPLLLPAVPRTGPDTWLAPHNRMKGLHRSQGTLQKLAACCVSGLLLLLRLPTGCHRQSCGPRTLPLCWTAAQKRRGLIARVVGERVREETPQLQVSPGTAVPQRPRLSPKTPSRMLLTNHTYGRPSLPRSCPGPSQILPFRLQGHPNTGVHYHVSTPSHGSKHKPSVAQSHTGPQWNLESLLPQAPDVSPSVVVTWTLDLQGEAPAVQHSHSGHVGRRVACPEARDTSQRPACLLSQFASVHVDRPWPLRSACLEQAALGREQGSEAGVPSHWGSQHCSRNPAVECLRLMGRRRPSNRVTRPHSGMATQRLSASTPPGWRPSPVVQTAPRPTSPSAHRSRPGGPPGSPSI